MLTVQLQIHYNVPVWVTFGVAQYWVRYRTVGGRVVNPPKGGVLSSRTTHKSPPCIIANGRCAVSYSRGYTDHLLQLCTEYKGSHPKAYRFG